MPFRDLSIATKQKLGFGFILLLMVGAGLFAVNRSRAISDEAEQTVALWLPRVVAISDVNLEVGELRIRQLQHATATVDSVRQAQAVAMIDLIDAINLNLDTYAVLTETAQARGLNPATERDLYARFESFWEQYLDIANQLLTLTELGAESRATSLLRGEATQVYQGMSATLANLVEANRTQAAAGAARAEETFRATTVVIIVLLAAAALLAVGIVSTLVASMAGPVRRLAGAADRMAEGDLDVYVEPSAKDELGRLTHSFNVMAASLRKAQRQTEEQAAKLQDNAAMLQQQTDMLQGKNDELASANDELATTLDQLQEMQQQLVMREKLASLGQLTAGIAHEIKNPLNFVNNFAALSIDLMQEVDEVLQESLSKPVSDVLPDLDEVLADLRTNVAKINEHGTRADRIVRGMLLHARGQPGDRQRIALNALLDEHARLAFHGMRARRPGFNVDLRTELDPAVGEVKVVPQSIGQVMLNLLTNAFHAVNERRLADDSGDYAPVVTLRSSRDDNGIRISVTDNGAGVSEANQARIFEPFFTTKGPGEGTGLGLWLSYGIVTQGHSGTLNLTSTLGEGTIFTVTLPTD
ncbi:MAG: ATP-binding protein [Bacteroidota bacterium]